MKEQYLQCAFRASKSPPGELYVGTAYVLCTILTVTTFTQGVHRQALLVYLRSKGGGERAEGVLGRGGRGGDV